MTTLKRKPRRPPHGTEPKVRISILIEKELLNALKTNAQHKSLPYQTLIHQKLKLMVEPPPADARVSASKRDTVILNADLPAAEIMAQVARLSGFATGTFKGKDGSVTWGTGPEDETRTKLLLESLYHQIKLKSMETAEVSSKSIRKDNTKIKSELKEIKLKLETLHRKASELSDSLLKLGDLRAGHLQLAHDQIKDALDIWTCPDLVDT